MALSIWCEPVCATCSTTAEGTHVYGGKIPVRYLVKIAKQARWIVTRDEFYCSRFCFDNAERTHPTPTTEAADV